MGWILGSNTGIPHSDIMLNFYIFQKLKLIERGRIYTLNIEQKGCFQLGHSSPTKIHYRDFNLSNKKGTRGQNIPIDWTSNFQTIAMHVLIT